MNKNETLKWYREQLNIGGEQSKIILDNEFLQYDHPVRGIYGIFIGKDSPEICVYVGRAENLYKRMFKGDGHLVNISKGCHTNPKLNEAIEERQKVFIKLLKEVPYEKGNCTEADYNIDMQRLASAENKYIDIYQKKGQCLWQLPEGKHISYKEWCKK